MRRGATGSGDGDDREGPEGPGLGSAAPWERVELGPGETLDRLARDWWILQLEKGQRYATDDVLTAWAALSARPRALRVLDLGAGVGSVGLLVLGALGDEARLTSVEALEQSVALARRTVELNGIAGRVTLRLGDLRQEETLEACDPFDLVTANPPFLPPGSGWMSPHPQRSAARFELRGDVFDYCRAAAERLAPEGRFVFCHAAKDPRPERAVEAAGLRMLGRREVAFRAGRPPHLALFVCGREGEAEELEPLTVRDGSGARTAAYVEVLRALGMVE